MNQVELRIDGKVFAGWTSVKINRSIESLSGYFDLGVMVQPDTDLSSLATGKAFTLSIDNQCVITGWTDGRTRRISGDSLKSALPVVTRPATWWIAPPSIPAASGRTARCIRLRRTCASRSALPCAGS